MMEGPCLCPSSQQICAYLADCLDSEAEAAIAAHLEGCARCRQTREEICTDRELEPFRLAPFTAEWNTQLQTLCSRLREQTSTG